MDMDLYEKVTNEFLKEYSQYSEVDANNVRKVVYNFNKFLKNNNIDTLSLNRELFKTILEGELGNERYLKKTKFLLKKYLECLLENGFITHNIMDAYNSIPMDELKNVSVLENGFFPNFNNLETWVKRNIDSMDGIVDHHRWDVSVAAIYMTWIGIKAEELLNLEVKNVDLDNQKVILGNESLDIPDAAVPFFEEYLYSLGYYANGKGGSIKFVKYLDVSHVFREIRTSNRTVGNIHRAIARFNYLPNKKFAYEKIRMSGCFHRLFLYETMHSVITTNKNATKNRDKINSIFRENLVGHSFFDKVSEYRKFVEYFYQIKK